ncbi:hypothetical protein ABTE23_21060, partial [Acinetobacter baumannii]
NLFLIPCQEFCAVIISLHLKLIKQLTMYITPEKIVYAFISLLLSVRASSQTRLIQGKIKEAGSNRPAAGASVIVKEAGKGTIT